MVELNKASKKWKKAKLYLTNLALEFPVYFARNIKKIFKTGFFMLTPYQYVLEFLYKIQRVIILLKSRSVLFKSWWNFGIVVFTLDSNPRSCHNYLNIVDFLLVWRHLYCGDLKVRDKIFLVAVFKRIFAISKFFYNIKIKIISRKLIISSSTINQLN